MTDLPVTLPLPGLSIDTVGARPTDLTAIDPGQVLDALGTLRGLTDQVRWVLGDLTLAVAVKIGDAEAIRQVAAQGHHPPTLAAAVAVCAAIPHSMRRPTLTWSHHAEVHRLDRLAIDLWLGRAESEAWTVRQLRDALAADRAERNPPLPGTGPLPRPPETPLRQALDEVGPDGYVIWGPGSGNLAPAVVKHVDPRGATALVVIEVPAALATMLDHDHRGAA